MCTVHMSYLKQPLASILLLLPTLINTEDLVGFLAHYQVFGHAMADYNMDGIVNVLDLNSHLIWTGQFTEPFNCA